MQCPCHIRLVSDVILIFNKNNRRDIFVQKKNNIENKFLLVTRFWLKKQKKKL